SPIELLRPFGFTRDIKRLGRLHLHAKGEFERLNSGLEMRILLPCLPMALVQLREQIELPSLLLAIDRRILNIGQQLSDFSPPSVEVGSLVDSRQKRTSPIRRIGNRQSGTQHNEAGE